MGKLYLIIYMNKFLTVIKKYTLHLQIIKNPNISVNIFDFVKEIETRYEKNTKSIYNLL